MTDSKKTKAQLISENKSLRNQVAKLTRLSGSSGVNTDSTQSNHSQEDLWETRDSYKKLVEMSQDAILVHANGNIKFANPSAAELLGYQQPENMLGIPALDIVFPEDKKDIRSRQRQTMANEGKLEFGEERLRRCDGSEVIAEVAAVQMRYDGRRAIKIVARDLTKFKLKESALHRSEKRLQLLTDSLPFFISYVDVERRYHHVNRAYEERFGHSRDWIIGRHVREVLGDAAYETIRGYLDQAFSGETVTYEDIVPYAKGGSRHHHSVYVPDFDENGKVKGLFVSVIDITDRKRTEEALQESHDLLESRVLERTAELQQSEERFSKVFQESPLGISLIDAEFRILEINPRLCQMLGYSKQELLGISFPEITYPGDYEENYRLAKQVQKGEIPSYQMEKRYIRKDGSIMHANLTASVIRDESGNFRFGIGMVEDISERKKSEEELWKQEMRFRNLVEGSIQGIMIQRGGKALFVNQSFAEIFGYESTDEIFEMENLNSLVVAQDREKMRKYGEKRLGGEEAPVQYLLQGLKKDGTPIWLDTLVHAVDWDGEPAILSTIFNITERKKAEEALLENEKKFKSIINHSPSVMSLKDLKGRYILVNRCFEDLHGFFEQEVIGKTNFDIFPESFAKKIEAQEKILVKTGQVITGEVGVPISDGSIIPTINIKFPIYGGDNRIVGIGTIATDITERKRAEEELKKSEELFRSTVDNSPSSIFLKNLDGRYLMVNREYERWIGMTSEEIIGKSTTELYATQFSDSFLALDQEVLETRKPVQMEMDVPRSDGVRLVINTKFPVYDSEGQLNAIGTIFTDITERKKAEEALRESRDQVRLITDKLPAIIIYVDKDERYRFINKTAEKWFMRPSVELIGEKSKENLGKEEYRKLEPSIKKVLSGEEVKFQTQINYRDGKSRFIEFLYVPDFEENGATKGYFALGRDITDQKILEDQLRQSQKMEALGTLTGGIAHDFNNILTPILGYSHLLLNNSDPDSKEHQYLNSISTSAIRAKDLVSQILLYSRRGKTEKVNYDLRTVTGEVIGLIRATFSKSIKIKIIIHDDINLVFCDPSQIYQVLLNLCVNAEQAMGELGELKIELGNVSLDGIIDYSGKELSGDFVRMALSDTGIGMSNETLAQIFDPFFTKREVGEGTGLGLSTVFGIVKDHDGGIVVTSQPNRGSAFEIFLPVVEVTTDQPIISETQVPKGSETILFVDDEAEIVKLGKSILEDHGYRVTVFSNPLDALEKFKADPDRFDLVITDQSMPEMNGEKLAGNIRAIKAKIPIILCTGYSRTITPESSKSIGINHFLYKPIYSDELCRVVRDVLDKVK